MMQPTSSGSPEDCPEGDGEDQQTLLERIGWARLLMVVWRSTPMSLRLFAFPYGAVVYGRLLGISYDLDQLLAVHCEKYSYSTAFRLLRPRYHKVKSLLTRFEETTEDASNPLRRPADEWPVTRLTAPLP
jgi:hypothetical protein